MPANLPPEYYSAELRFKQASSPQEKILALEELISTIPKHKGTDKLRADFRRRLSKLRDESAKKKKSGKGDLYTVEKHGASQSALVGFANSGKSSVLAAITNAHPVIAEYPMSTVMPLSGMMPFEDIQFQIIDLPPIGNDSTDGWVSGILRSTNMLVLVVDAGDDPNTQTELLLDQLNNWNISLLKMGAENNTSGVLKPKPAILLVNKSDAGGQDSVMMEMNRIYGQNFPVVYFSALMKQGVDELKKVLFTSSGIIRVYSKEPGKEPDMDSPFTLSYGSNILDLAQIIHKDFVRSLKYACIWGSAKFDGQRVQKDYLLHDRDIVEYHIK